MPKLLCWGLLILSSGLFVSCVPSQIAPPQSSSSPQLSVAPEVSIPQSGSLLAASDKPDPETTAQIQQYLTKLASQGFLTSSQGVWIQSGDTLLANHQGTKPLSAASLTKVATSLAALQTFGPKHQFVTLIGTTGSIQNGVLQGDLVVPGGEDPLFIWEEAIALGNLLNQLQIRRVTGNLVIVGKFYMNFELNPAKSGALLKQALNAQAWSEEPEAQYRTLPPGTPRPQVNIAGTVRVASKLPTPLQPLLQHNSPPLAELLKKMNQYSNNAMAEIIANSVGGANAVKQKVIQTTGIPAAEISLVNGSGLSPANRISPRAVCAMFRAIAQTLQPHKMTVADIFAVVGQDEGILSQRGIPRLAVVKSGSLDAVSALAGALPTQQKGVIWFVIMNGGDNLEGFRAGQEALLSSFVNQWGAVPTLPAELTPTLSPTDKLSRNQVVK
jgi:D-alanyl-D-alanine carboxypeptidase/D-alanyl-D-alanine-endopeptidase (penicillin-binding protein 4)